MTDEGPVAKPNLGTGRLASIHASGMLIAG